MCIKVIGAALNCGDPKLFQLYASTTSTPGFYGHFKKCTVSAETTNTGLDICTFECVCPLGLCPITIDLPHGPVSSGTTLCEVQRC